MFAIIEKALGQKTKKRHVCGCRFGGKGYQTFFVSDQKQGRKRRESIRKEKPGSSYTYSRRKKRKTKQKDDNFFGNIHQTEEKLIQNEKNGSNTRKVKISDFK